MSRTRYIDMGDDPDGDLEDQIVTPMDSRNLEPRYWADIYGPSFSGYVGVHRSFLTIRDARGWAEEFGTTADKCVITTLKGKVVALHVRDHSGDGTRWRRATP